MKKDKIKIKPISFGVLLAGKVADGSKTVTRRVVKSEFPDLHVKDWKFAGINLHDDFPNHAEFRRDAEANENFISQSIFTPCPYTVGQLLYVREPWQVSEDYDTPSGSQHIPDAAEVTYLTDGNTGEWGRRRIARFMPARFARTFLMVTDVRCERLGEISEADAINEGVECLGMGEHHHVYKHYLKAASSAPLTARDSFGTLWDSINGKDSCLQNPWVWVISFERVEMPNPWNSNQSKK